MTHIKRTPKTLTVQSLKFRIKRHFDIMEEGLVEEVLFQNGMMEHRRMDVPSFIELVKNYQLMKSRNGYFLEPKGNKNVSDEIYPR